MAIRIAEEPDGILATRLSERQNDSFSELYRHLFPRLVRLCNRRLGDSEAAEDAAQETFVRALRSLGRFDQSRPMWPWLKVIATHVASDYASSKTRETCFLNEKWPLLLNEDAEWRLCEERSVLAQAISKLNLRQRMALGLRYLGDWDSAEAARFFGLSKNSFEQLLFRARRRLLAEYRNFSREAIDKAQMALPPILGQFFARIRSRIAKTRQHLTAFQADFLWRNSVAAMALLAAAIIASSIVTGLPSSDRVTSTDPSVRTPVSASNLAPPAPASQSRNTNLLTPSDYSKQIVVGSSSATATVSGEVTKKRLAVGINVTSPAPSVNATIPVWVDTDAECDYSAVQSLACEIVDNIPQ